jgi:hypothetical protein
MWDISDPVEQDGGHVFGYLGNYGVAEAAQSVHPSGNPISHSTHVGFNAPPVGADGSWPANRFGSRPAVRSPTAFVFDASGVGSSRPPFVGSTKSVSVVPLFCCPCPPRLPSRIALAFRADFASPTVGVGTMRAT